MNRRPPAAVLCSVAAALILGACSTGPDATVGSAGVPGIAPPAAGSAPAPADAPVPTDPPAVPAPGASGPTGPAGGAPGPGGVGRPAPDQCVGAPEAPDGVYPMYEAGSATIVREGNRLVLVDYEASTGWVARIDDLDSDEVEIEWRQGFSELELEVEIDDGVVDVRVCAD